MKLPLERTRRHIESVNQLLNRFCLRIYVQHTSPEIIVHPENGNKQSGQRFFVIESPQFDEQHFLLDVLKMDTEHSRLYELPGGFEFFLQQGMDGKQSNAVTFYLTGAWNMPLQLFYGKTVTQSHVSGKRAAHQRSVLNGTSVELVSHRNEEQLLSAHPLTDCSPTSICPSLQPAQTQGQNGLSPPLPDTCRLSPPRPPVWNVRLKHNSRRRNVPSYISIHKWRPVSVSSILQSSSVKLSMKTNVIFTTIIPKTNLPNPEIQVSNSGR